MKKYYILNFQMARVYTTLDEARHEAGRAVTASGDAFIIAEEVGRVVPSQPTWVPNEKE